MTIFHAALPLLKWSKLANLRAIWYGSSYVVLAVAANPIFSVHCESAERSVKGSKEVVVCERWRAGMGMFRTARWSAMKKASNFARSRVWM